MTNPANWREAPAAQFAVIGDPVSHSRSPQMHMAAFAVLGLPHRYVAIHVPVGETDQALDHLGSLGYLGANITVPLKAEALAWAASADDFGKRCGAVNTIRFSDRSGINTDGMGFIDTLSDLSLPSKNVFLLGAGGSARAIALSLALEGYNLSVLNRTPARAHALLDELSVSGQVVTEPTLEGIGLIVNATSASLQNEALALPWEQAMPGCVAYDLMYGHSPFLAVASGHGLPTVDGLPLLVAQGARSFEYWLAAEAPREAMRRAVQ